MTTLCRVRVDAEARQRRAQSPLLCSGSGDRRDFPLRGKAAAARACRNRRGAEADTTPGRSTPGVGRGGPRRSGVDRARVLCTARRRDGSHDRPLELGGEVFEALCRFTTCQPARPLLRGWLERASEEAYLVSQPYAVPRSNGHRALKARLAGYTPRLPTIPVEYDIVGRRPAALTVRDLANPTPAVLLLTSVGAE